MSEKEIWKYCWEKKVFYSRPFDRDFIWIAKEDFLPIEGYFKEEYNILHSNKSLRSRGMLLHLHAIDEGDYIFLHRDMGNIRRFFPLGIIHLTLDVMPYFIFARAKGIRMRSIFSRPDRKLLQEKN